LRSETAHDLLDPDASLSVVVRLGLLQRRSRDLPYGLNMLENVVAVFIAFGMFLTGYEIVREALFASRRMLDVRPVILAGVALTLITPLAFSRYELRVGRAMNRPAGSRRQTISVPTFSPPVGCMPRWLSWWFS